jgi:4a-hydroxytetrahydrobiopterin dehydratase
MAPALIQPTDLADRLAAELPAWHAEGGSIVRRFETTGWKATLMVVNAIGHLAETAWHHPDLVVGFGSVEVRLSTHDSGGVTGLDLALARMIDTVVGWAPAGADGLTGPPKGAALLKPA